MSAALKYVIGGTAPALRGGAASASLRLLGVLALASLAACAQRGGRAFEDSDPRALAADDGNDDCEVPAEGCACAGNQPPVACHPDGTDPQLNGDGERVCIEGTRYCRDGRFSACEDVRAFTLPARPSGTALVDQVSEHPRCSPCEPECHVVVDSFNPDDGPLDGGFVEGLTFHGSGAGVTLEAHDAGDLPDLADGGVPDGTVFIGVDEGLTGSGTALHSEYASAADVYLLLDMSSSMSEEDQWVYEQAKTGSGFLPATLTCADGDATQLSAGMTGALSCMVGDLRVGAGMFRDIPFAPYSEDQNAADPARTVDAKHEIPYRHGFDFTPDMTMASLAFANVGAIESSGDPDFAGSQIPALYSVATGTGMFTGVDRRSVPAGPSCGAGQGYPCFRPAIDRIVVLASDAPMHNGPSSASLPYDYDPAQLDMSLPTVPGVAAIPNTNDDWPNAYALSSDVAPELRMFSGDSTGLGAQIGAAAVGCGANAAAPDATFMFGVNAPGGGANTVPIKVSAEGTSFPAALAVYDHLPGLTNEALPPSSTNEQFASAYDVGDMVGREVSIDGDIHANQNDYQGSLYGAACGAGYSGDAVFEFDVASAGAAREIEVSATMGSDHPVVSVYRQGAGALPSWPGLGSASTATNNDDATPGKVYHITLPAASPYVAVQGSTLGFAADYDTTTVGSTACSPETAALDAAFQIHLDARRRLRFDTEGSSFNTVLSLHSQRPFAINAPATHHTAAATHGNTNEDSASAYATGPINGLDQIFEGDTTGMRADVDDTFSCGLDDACGDAVYKISVATATTLRLAISGTGYEPGVVLTRAAPEHVSGEAPVVATGGGHTCAASGGAAYCWGRDDSGQLGNGGASGDPDATAPVQVSGLGSVVQLCAGASHSCAVLHDGRVACWGNGASGQLGTGTTNDAFAPALLTEFGPAAPLGPAVQVACGEAFSCALLADGRVACFGDNVHGQLGNGTTTEHDSATPINSTERFEQLAAGNSHACAVRASDDALFCWGEGSHGKLGDGATSDNLVPARVGSLIGVSAVAAGDEHTCAVLSSGRALCWGSNEAGQLGIGSVDSTDHAAPVDVQNAAGSARFTDAAGVTAGTAHSCLLGLTGLVFCFGDDSMQQLGNGSGYATSLPGTVATIADVTRVFGGYAHGCALERSGSLACWGDNTHGQLGAGDEQVFDAPVAAQAGTAAPLAFGAGKLDGGVAHACRSIAQPPEAGCQLKLDGSRAYEFCNDEARTWAGAAQACDRAGMQLANIDTLGENAFIADGIDFGERAWFGLKRVSSADGLSVDPPIDFENLPGDLIWHTTATTRCLFRIGTTCISREDSIRGYFEPVAPTDLISSNPYWTFSSTWATQLNPATTAGHNCATVNSSGKWATDDCSSSAPYDGRGGLYATPPFAGGVAHPYVCEERVRYTDVALDPGDYYVTVKGVNDGVVGNSCTGAYELKLTDLGADGGFIACDDDGVYESTQSAFEQTLNAGDYYLILKGKHAGDEGSYKLTVRDVDAVQIDELACDAGSGVMDPASVRFVADPNERYYALIKSVGPNEEGPYTLSIRDADGDVGPIACDAGSSPSGNAEMTLDLRSGTYYAVLKGSAPNAAGSYQLTVGGASPISNTFAPAGYDATVNALNAAGIRVASVLSCAGRPSCADAQAQAAQLATDTHGIALDAASAEDVPLQIVRAVEQLERAETVTGTLTFTPDTNPGFTPNSVLALDDPSNRCAPSPTGPTFADCLPGSTPSFVVSLHNPALAPVPFSNHPSGAYNFTLHVESKRNGVVIGSRDVPLVVLPTGAPPPGTYSAGSYFQDIDGRACLANQRPSWDVLRFDADVRPDTKIDFYACTAAKEEDLAACNGGAGVASGRKRTLTVTADTGAGTACTVATQSVDCPDGYCSPYTHICNHLEGASCLVDVDCPGSPDGFCSPFTHNCSNLVGAVCSVDTDCPRATAGVCRNGPSSATLGRTCEVRNLQADPGSALDSNNYQPFMRVEADLHALGDGSRTPSLFFWEAWYRCRMLE